MMKTTEWLQARHLQGESVDVTQKEELMLLLPFIAMLLASWATKRLSYVFPMIIVVPVFTMMSVATGEAMLNKHYSIEDSEMIDFGAMVTATIAGLILDFAYQEYMTGDNPRQRNFDVCMMTCFGLAVIFTPDVGAMIRSNTSDASGIEMMKNEVIGAPIIIAGAGALYKATQYCKSRWFPVTNETEERLLDNSSDVVNAFPA